MIRLNGIKENMVALCIVAAFLSRGKRSAVSIDVFSGDIVSVNLTGHIFVRQLSVDLPTFVVIVVVAAMKTFIH